MRRAALTLSLAVGGVALAPAAATAASCTPPAAARGVAALLADIDRGEGRAAAARMMLSSRYAQGFTYYGTVGVSPAPARPTWHTSTHRRPLIRYLAGRHAAGERVRLVALKMEHGGDGALGFQVIVGRAAPDLGSGGEYFALGKGGWSCRRGALIKLLAGISVHPEWDADPARLCGGSNIRRETIDGVRVCARKWQWPR